EIVDIAVAPDETVYITDQLLNLAYVFVPPHPGELDEKGKPLGPYDYKFKGTRFADMQFKKLGGIAIDSHGRIYAVDAHSNNVRRFNPDGKVDESFRFEQKKPDGDTYLHGCEGVAIDEQLGNLFIASEKDSVIVVFDAETGAYRQKMVGASVEGDKPAGKHVFFGSVEGLTLAGRHLLAVDEGAGHIQVFNLDNVGSFNTDLTRYGTPRRNRPSGYRGYFGHGPVVNFEDKTNLELQKQVKLGAILPGQANPPGNFCSPDAIASYTDVSTGEIYIAIADQCNYRLAVYRWSDISKSLGQPITLTALEHTNHPAPRVVANNVAAPAATTAAPAVTRTSPPVEAARRTSSATASRSVVVGRRSPRAVVVAVPPPKQQKKKEPEAKGKVEEASKKKKKKKQK
ncbi:MAG: hypothetical protein ABI882_01010, partial [Acidobacteriota bacterium]